MSRKFLTPIDLNQLEIQNAVWQNLGTAPSSPVAGQIYYDTTLGTGRMRNASGWVNLDISTLTGSANPFARANHTGTQTASTISNLATTVQAYTLDQFGAPVANVNANNNKVTNLAAPTAGSNDAATALYVDNAVQSAAAGIDSKPSVRVVSTNNITLSGTQTIDSVALNVGDRVLCKAQTTGANNGVYVVASGAWARAIDADQTGEISSGAFWCIEEGTANGGSQYICANTGTITLGTTSITINKFSAGTPYTASAGVKLVGVDFEADLAASGGIINSSGLKVDRSLVPMKYAATIGDGSTTAIVVTHSLGTQDVVMNILDASTKNQVICDMQATSTNTATFTFAVAPATNAYRVVIVG